jgi:hypothetical protein
MLAWSVNAQGMQVMSVAPVLWVPSVTGGKVAGGRRHAH